MLYHRRRLHINMFSYEEVPDPTPYSTRILQRPVTREDLVLRGFQNDLRNKNDFWHSSSPFPRVGVMDWKSKSASQNQEPVEPPSDLRQFNLSQLKRSGGLDTYDLFTKWHLNSASQIAATESEFRESLLNMDGIHSRVVILEQTPHEVVEILGSIYNIDPEFWAQHMLLRDHESWTWDTSQQPKPFFSVRWCHTVSFQVESPPWAHDWGPIDSNQGPANNPHEIVPWFQSSHDLVLDCNNSKDGSRRRLRALFHSQKSFGDNSVTVPAALEQCVSVYFHQSKDAVPKTTSESGLLLMLLILKYC